MRSGDVTRYFEPRPATAEASDLTLVTSYRYLRLAMVGLVGLLGVSVLLERSKVDCWQTSISAYYYTPVRAIFVGGLIAIGFALIVIKGRTPAQDILLNVAGMMAPVVAVVPISGVGQCWSVEPGPSPVGDDGRLAPWVAANIDNNIVALLIAGVLGLALTAGLTYAGDRRHGRTRRVWTGGMVIGLAGTAVLLAATYLAFLWWDGFHRSAHYIAAFAMFICLGIVVANDAWDRHSRGNAPGYRLVYAAISGAMLLGGLVLGVLEVATDFAYVVLVLEIVEIVLFAAYWIAQTVEFWSLTPDGRPMSPDPTIPAPGAQDPGGTTALDVDLRVAPPASGVAPGAAAGVGPA
jgi:hypothetical protein